MTSDYTIKKVIDTYLQECIDAGINNHPGEIEIEMKAPNQDPKEEWRMWLPIDSKVTDTEIESFEVQLGHKLPADYKVFLKHKHFYDLYISEATFCKHPVNKWRDHLKKMIFKGWPLEYLFDKGYIHFADWSDWGALCFDTNRNFANNDYPIILWDHDRPLEIQDVSQSFIDLIIKLDKEHKEMTIDNQEE
ncbi:SMI1/KNR4 family protein [Chitinophaga caeni]|uniref:SMI1/KNR4 family protein n=1 Tax=Chitinophaga caeni TaxID=2029983 RepID=A0A291QZC9_9BACT|nr:SMI1/KNR4 family protein [Chitinophaga caeni]ATL49310.1 SMI1/KNR4 family protein [Chitinophaga caeni]